MVRKLFNLVCLVVLVVGGVTAGCGGRSRSEAGGSAAAGKSRRLGKPRYRLAVIPKGTTHEFWKSVHYGAVQAGDEFGAEILWQGPLLEQDREGQITVVQNFITRRVDGIVLAPIDSQALVAPVKEAAEEGIPVVIFDSGLDDPGGWSGSRSRRRIRAHRRGRAAKGPGRRAPRRHGISSSARRKQRLRSARHLSRKPVRNKATRS